MTYPDPRVNPGGFPNAVDTWGNDPDLTADSPEQWKRELPPFGPAFVPFVDGRITELQKTVQRLIDRWAVEPVTIVDLATMQADGSGNIDTPQTPNATLYEAPAGFTFALHRLTISVVGSNFGTPYTSAAAYWELRRNGEFVYGASMVSGQGSLPAVKEWGTRDAPRLRAGASFSIFISGGAGLAGKQVQLGIQGTQDRTQEG